MAGKTQGRGGSQPKQVSAFAAKLIDPIVAQRVGMTTALLSAWPDIVGADIAAQSRPQRIKWPPRSADGEFQPGILIVAAKAMAALHLQHETDTIIARVNGFMGYTAVTGVRIEQRQLVTAERKVQRRTRPLTAVEDKRLSEAVAEVSDERLANALRAIGENVLREKRKP
ncbi:MAG: DciA family protein [Pseudomonadota bacterium]